MSFCVVTARRRAHPPLPRLVTVKYKNAGPAGRSGGSRIRSGPRPPRIMLFTNGRRACARATTNPFFYFFFFFSFFFFYLYLFLLLLLLLVLHPLFHYLQSLRPSIKIKINQG